MKLLKQTLSLLLTIAALTVGQSAWAASTWTITPSTSGTYTTFTISRSGDTSKSETVLYRFVGLSAYAGRHFVVAQINGGDIATSQQMSALSGTFTFAATETSKSVTIKEMDADNAAYIFQNGTSRNYKLEVTDQGGFLLKDCTRSFTTGTSVPSSGAFNVKDITIRSGEISVTDAGYAQGYHSMTVDNYFNNAAPKAYFQQVGAQLRMTLTFQCKEVTDGWQYVQIYANQSTSNIDTGAGDGNPGNCSYAKYVAGFEHKDSNADTEYKSYTFPVTSANNNEGATNPWGHGSGYNLHKQIFNNSRASDGRLIIPLDLSSLYVRYNASGSDKDDWVAKNTVAHIQAIDATAPTALDISVAPGYHAKGNTVYVSVAFKEIVTSSNAKLNTNWGTLSYNTGSGSNVLTFKGTIGNSATGSLNITGYSGTITDLAGNNFTGTITGSNLCALDANYNYPITYELNGGSVATANPATYTYDTATFTLNNPTRTGYTFDGWTGSNGTTASTAVKIEVHSHGDKSYTANWTAHTYTVSFHSNDGTDATSDQSFTYATAQNLTANAFTRTGYTFAGWSSTAGGAVLYTDGQEVNNLTPEDGGTVNLYAQWTAHTYTIHFDANGGSGNMSDMSFTYDETKNLTTNAFTRIGCTFAGWSTTPSGSVEYTDGQSVSNLTPDDGATFTLYAQWTDFWGTAGGADGTEEHPYIITTPAGFDLLAKYVNGTDGYTASNFNGKYFKLGADIAYDSTALDANGENYTAIGNYNYVFRGTFDGDGHTVSGIRINKTGSTNADKKQGLFGYVGSGGTVQNVILDDAHITGFTQVGGITGDMSFATITNCLVLNTAITATDNSTPNAGIISGYYSGTLTANYYHNCTLTKRGTTSTTNIGSGQNSVSDRDGARSAHTLTLPANVSVSAATESVTYNNVTYYASNSTVTLSPAVGYILTNVTVNGTAATDNGDGSWTFTMPAADATVSAAWTDLWGIASGADGTEQHPYTITTTAGLDLLATDVNNNERNYSGKHFVLGDDITYTHGNSDTENNYTAIGQLSRNKYFAGIFDGQNNTISGIRIYKDGTDDSNDYQGLFGHLNSSAVVKNVILTDAVITGNERVGGIVGYINSGIIDNCTVTNTVTINTVVSNSNYHGGIAGQCGYKRTITNCTSSARLTITSGSGNAYYGGIVGYASTSYINNNLVIGAVLPQVSDVSAIIGKDNNSTTSANYYRDVTIGTDTDLANIFTLTLPDGVSVSAASESVIYNNVTYYASNSTVTLSPAVGYILTNVTVNGTAATDNGDGSWTFTMPAADTEVTASLVPNTYTVHFDANGGSGSMSDMSFTYDETKNLTTNAFTRIGCTFAGWSTTSSGSVEYTDGQSVSNLTPDDGATFTLYAQWTDFWGTAGGADGTEEHPYTITTPAGLDLLATYVNNGNEFPDTYFKLGDDITYTHGDSDTENNYTAIGTEQKAFLGNFDGDGHTISGIRIYKPSENYQGLFGRIYEATVKNVILNDARITGKWYIGGISGQMNGYTTIPSIENCLVLNSSITANSSGGAVIGASWKGTFNNNHYHNCSLTQGGTTKTTDIGLNNADHDGARSAHTLTLPANVSVSAATESVTCNNVTYYASTSTVTLSPAIGYILTDVTVNGTAATNNGDGTWTFTMPAADATVSATLSEDPNTPVAILNDGSTSYYLEATYTTAEAALRAALDDAANASGSTVTLFRDVTLATDNIECDDGTYTLDLNGHSITGSDGVLVLVGANITLIDGSSAKTGSITDTGSSKAIVMFEGTLNCTGCTISSNLSTGTGVEYLSGTLTLTDCTITGNIALSKETNSSNITLTNCTITGTSYGILRRDGVFLSLTDCTITGNVGIAYMDPPSSGNYGSQSFIGNNTIKGCTYAGILIDVNVKFKNLPHFGTGSDANGCDIASASGIIDFQTPDQSAYYYVPATPITVKAVGWDNYANAYVDREVGAGAGSYTFAINCNHIKYPNTSTTIPIEEVFVSLNSDYIVRTPIYHTSSYNYSSTNSSPAQLTKPVVLNDNANNNASTIENFNDEDCAVTLQGRTLWKDGYWNTLCVPFKIDAISKTPLAGAEIRSLESASLDDEGLLTLNFSDPVTTLIAGTPYIIKWTRANDYVDDDAHNLVNPLFSSVCVYDNTDDFTSTDGTVQFKGTYAPINFTPGDKSILFMGADNTLYYPASGAYINACRAYFKLSDPNAQVKNFAFSFGNGDDDDPTGVLSQESRVKSQESTVNDLWYDLNGRRLANRPTRPGIYINNGKKIIIK